MTNLRNQATQRRITSLNAGAGASQHMLPEWFSAATGMELLHVPFKGGTAVVTEVIAGRVDLIFETMTLTLPQVKSGRLRAQVEAEVARWNRTIDSRRIERQ